jgi:SAM-dependent methyltransferase
MTSYDGFAAVYDEVLGRRYHQALIPRLLKEFRRLDLFPPGRVLDAGCGSGMLVEFLRDRGFGAFGLDLSLGMVRAARDRCLPVLQASMAAFAVAEPLEAVVCHYDSLNHVTDPAAVRAALACFHAALKPGGRLVMDTNNAWAFRHVFGSPRPYETEFDGGSARMETSFDPATGLARAVVTGRRDGVAFEDRLEERFYPRALLRQWLHEAGFRGVRAEGWSPGRAYGGREVKDFWSARRG